MPDILPSLIGIGLCIGLIVFAFVTSRRRRGQRKEIAAAQAMTVEVAKIADRRHRAMYGRPSSELGSVLPRH